MIPKIYGSGYNYIGVLPDCIKGIAIEERNGMCEIEITYPIFSPNWEAFKRGNIVVADVNDTLKSQMFRIYKISKPISGKINIYARHIFFDLSRDLIEGLELNNASCEYALNELFRNSQFSKDFRGHSDIINAQNYKMTTVNLIKAIGGHEGSILDTYGTGAEILRDNKNVYVLNRRGRDNGVTIEYAKNMTGLNIEFDDSNLITRIKAVAKYTDESSNEIIVESNPRYVDSPKINDYETPFITEIDFSSEFENGVIPTPTKLRELAERYFRNNKCDEVKINIKVEFIPLSRCVGYEDIQDKISLCDIVTIKDYRYKLDTQAKVIKTYFDFLSEKYEKMELGEPKTSLGDLTGKGEDGEDGKMLYTWIKYADDQHGNGISDLPLNKKFVGLAYNKTNRTPSNNPEDYTWSKIQGDQGIPGKPGADGKTKYTWVKYADTPTSGMSDDPTGKVYLGLAFNKEVPQESTNYSDYTWSKIKGEQGEPGQDGRPGDLSDFPDTLPQIPTLTTKLYGFANIELSWTFENKIYYTYELYASKVKDFTPNVFDLIFQGQASTFLHQVKPNETWYYRVRAINTHGNATGLSKQITVSTVKINDLSNYVDNAAIGEALIGTLSLDRGWVGQLKGNWIDAKQLSVTDGNGKRTLDIDSYGNVNLDVASLKIKSKDVATKTELSILDDKIEHKVDSGEFGTLISQNAYAVKIAWNNISNYVQFENGGLSIYNGETTALQKRSVFDENGSHFWRDGYYLGKIGTNRYSGDNSLKGFVFDLEADAAYMTWAVKRTSAGNYLMKWSYANKTLGSYTEGRLHASCDIDMHNYTLRNVDFEGGGINGTLVFTQIVGMNSNGTASRWFNNSKLVFQNGILVDATWGNP